MDILTRTELEQLMIKDQQWCISIYLPTHRTGTDAQQDPLRLRNMLAEAEKRLSASGVSPRTIQKMLEPANQLLQDSHFWQHQSDGLAIFISSNRVRSYRLPLDFEELMIVEDRFYINPLLPLFTGDGQFYILALSQNHVRLLNGTRFNVSEVDIGEVVGSLAESIPTGDHQVNLQHHSSGSAGGKKGNSTAFHGQGGGSESSKPDLLRYFHLIDDGLKKYLQVDRAPLVLAGVDYLLPIYKEANTYSNLIDEVIKGNPDLLSADELHQKAWEIIGPRFQTEQEDAVAHFQQLSGQSSKRVVETLDEILPAAYQGRVEILFVAAGEKQWGIFNPEMNEITYHDQREAGDEPMLDMAAVQTYLKGGVVYILGSDKMPGERYAAVLRY
jgi:hypothetical protein